MILMESVIISVQGHVQGVGFRWTTLRLARQLHIVGWVKNEADGSVTIRAQAPQAQLDEFLQAIKASPSPYATVSNVTISKEPEANFKKFQITD
ncbi:hypothetical protein FD04_GL000911 [Secundilactobacillus odoratitofui DSM 19909 = JCM 15043]|uniref:acylphosphatase n=2 Tax=Secundilactobacillus odoratitofui TaxID=480930 RepID=A0A0R1LQZ7_9LACO|nr:hypothetical protein FD04_GL000911 [Secundilactobacillus odoratitofui DSM 19909 = JCM 15043]